MMDYEIRFQPVVVVVSDDPDDVIKKGDVFFFNQHDGTPTLRIAKEGEDWSGYVNSITGQRPYLKVKSIEGFVLSPREIARH
jgi:hypothetical protein